MPPTNAKPRILFMADAVTLAHVARPHVLANSLDQDRFEVLFAVDPRYQKLFADAKYPTRAISSLDSKAFLQALAQGKPVFETATLQAYVNEDLNVIDQFKPDLIVSDFRISLSISARLRKIPYIGLTNAYWSPFARLRYPVPDLPMTKILGIKVSQLLFDLVRPVAFGLHAMPMNRLRRIFKLPSLGFDVRKVYTDADVLLMCDVPSLVNVNPCPTDHHFIGNIDWSPCIPLPDWWGSISREKPWLYVTLGSSGDESLLPMILEVVSKLPVIAIVSLAGRTIASNMPKNVFSANYLPGATIAAHADLVICNGGSPTTHQALQLGKPVIGVPFNLDQFLNMVGIERAGAGKTVRPGRGFASRLANQIQAIIADTEAAKAAKEIKLEFSRFDAISSFHQIIDKTL